MSVFADTVLVSTSVFTAENVLARPAAVAILQDKILGIYPHDFFEAVVGPDTKVIDCGDRTILPGFNDNHVHFFLGAIQNDDSFTLDLGDCTSEEEAVEKVRAFAEAHPENAWVYGCNWNSENWPGGDPTRRLLDEAVPDRPVNLASWDLHTDWVNAKGLELAGIDRNTPDHDGGVIDHFEDGEPNGLLHEPAVAEPVNQMSIRVPDLAKTAGKAISKCVAHGITSLGNVFPYGSMSEQELVDSFVGLEKSGNLPIRVNLWTELSDDLSSAEDLRENLHSEHVNFVGLKYLVDGISEMHTALQTEPYADDPSTYGGSNITKEELLPMLMQADEKGFSTRLHCIGNASVKMTLDCFQEVREEHGPKDLRNAIEHIESCCPEDVERFAKLGVIASMQPIHASIGASGYPALLGEKWIPFMWPTKSLIDSGAAVAFSSDYPVVEPNPMEEVWAAVTRSKLDDGLCFVPEQCVDLGTALRAHTYYSAYLSGNDDVLGTLSAGKLADIAVMDRDLFACSADDLKDCVASQVYVGGTQIYQA